MEHGKSVFELKAGPPQWLTNRNPVGPPPLLTHAHTHTHTQTHTHTDTHTRSRLTSFCVQVFGQYFNSPRMIWSGTTHTRYGIGLWVRDETRLLKNKQSNHFVFSSKYRRSQRHAEVHQRTTTVGQWPLRGCDWDYGSHKDNLHTLAQTCPQPTWTTYPKKERKMFYQVTDRVPSKHKS